MLNKLLTNNKLIATNVAVKDWKDAIKKGTTLLAENGFVELDTYYNAIIEDTAKVGPYYVLAPGIALPHSRATAGVSKIGISFMTLKNSVKFNHEANDPVDIVITLAALDNNTHLELMKEVGQILFDSQNIDRIRKATSDKELEELLLSMVG